jgi:hypothetical protein
MSIEHQFINLKYQIFVTLLYMYNVAGIWGRIRHGTPARTPTCLPNFSGTDVMN